MCRNRSSKSSTTDSNSSGLIDGASVLACAVAPVAEGTTSVIAESAMNRGDYEIPHTVLIPGSNRVVPIGYKRRMTLLEMVAVQAAAAALVLLRTTWGINLRYGGFTRRPLSSFLNLFIVAALSRLLFVPFQLIYRELFLAPRLNKPEDVPPSTSSQFREAAGIKVHLLHESPPSPETSNTVLHFNHGFGACSLSWEPVLARLARSLNARALAHDMPGFGLTQRVPLRRTAGVYTLQKNAEITRALLKPGDSGSDSEGGHKHTILFGHSMGGVTAALAAVGAEFEPRYTTLVLVAPALTAVTRTPATTNLAAAAAADAPPSPQQRRARLSMLAAPFRGLRSAGERAARFLYRRALLPVASPLVALSLHPIVYSGAFWRTGLQKAWFDKAGVGLEVVNRYRWPSLVRRWDRGLALFVLSQSRWSKVAHSDTPEEPLVAALKRKADAGMRIILIHGAQDPLVSAASSRALKSLIPAIDLVELQNCGHVPHEEMPDAFLDVLAARLSPQRSTTAAPQS
ncbi:Alpha/Beta hydrolase protein [Tribonema minus]|uniref:Alpha/Beta hydrolase protein n=1 Tax=Tribonema minus TaxID=303371 RepID=A0A835YWI6_9STRA|nr:Alpha/Beta hydrolase protein [Tribonema minus]